MPVVAVDPTVIATLVAEVASQTTITASILTFVAGLQGQLAAIANSTPDPATAATLTGLNTQITTNTAALAAAIPANTPSAPVAPAA